MDRLLAKGAIPPEMVEKIAAKLAHFHTQAATNPEISSFGEIQAVRGNVEENFAPDGRKYLGEVFTPGLYRETMEATRLFMERQSLLFEKRIRQGKIRDCHGDLHLQHICLGKEIIIFDCIEFKPALPATRMWLRTSPFCSWTWMIIGTPFSPRTWPRIISGLPRTGFSTCSWILQILRAPTCGPR